MTVEQSNVGDDTDLVSDIYYIISVVIFLCFTHICEMTTFYIK